MQEKATRKQIEYLRNLGYQGAENLDKMDASAKIDELLAKEKLQGVVLKCPFCKGEIRKRPKLSGTCPHCDRKFLHRRGKLYKPEVWYERAQKEDQREWLKETKAYRRETIQEALREQRQFESEMRRSGGIARADEAAGFIIRIGPNCHHIRHLDGLLVLVDDAKRDPDLLPPYEECCCDTCECDFDFVTKGEVPRGTRIAQRVLTGESPFKAELNRAPAGDSPFAPPLPGETVVNAQLVSDDQPPGSTGLAPRLSILDST